MTGFLYNIAGGIGVAGATAFPLAAFPTRADVSEIVVGAVFAIEPGPVVAIRDNDSIITCVASGAS